MKISDNECGFISCFKNPLKREKYDDLFGKKFGNIISEEKRKVHLKLQSRIISTFKEFYLKNNSSIQIKLRYIDMIDDIGLDEEENQYLYDDEEKKQLKRLLSSLTGKELLYKKFFKINSINDLEIILKFQLRTFRTVDFYFEKLNLMFKNTYEYTILVYGDYEEKKYCDILNKNKLYYNKVSEV